MYLFVKKMQCKRDKICNDTNNCFCTLPYYLPTEVILHNSINDCWISYFNKIFDLTNFCKLWQDTEAIRPILMNAGKDVSHWFDHQREDITYDVDKITGASVSCCPHGLIPNVDTDAVIMANSTSVSLDRCPWWLDDQRQVGWLTKNPRPCRIINVLIGKQATIMVCEEDSINRICERFHSFNSNGTSYTWKSHGKTLVMSKTLTENGIIDERDRYMKCGLPDNIYVPSILCYYNDDLSEAHDDNDDD